jgi:hypothetical protein
MAVTRHARAARLLSTLYLSTRRLVSALPSSTTFTTTTSNSVSLLGNCPQEALDIFMMGKREPVTPAVFWTKLGLSAALVLLGGVFAGLTLGLMGLDELHLKVLSSSSADETERSNAAKGMSDRSG